MTIQYRLVYFLCLTGLGILLMKLSSLRQSSIIIDQIMPITDLLHNETSLSSKIIGQQDQKVSYPWIGDTACEHFAVQFAKNKTRPKWVLTSFPGSGVTWIRQLIEGVTGIYTGTVYGAGEPPIVSTGYHGNEADLNCDCTILIKNHDHTESANLPFYLEVTNNLSMVTVMKENYGNRGILLLRNPFEALFTYFHYLKSGSDQIGIVSPGNFKGPEWNNYVEFVAYAWADHAIRWIQNIESGTVIFYEKLLLLDTEAELNRLLRVINFTDSLNMPVNPERMRCTLRHKNRLDRKRSKKPMIPLTFEQNSQMMGSIEIVQESLRQKGWPLLPLHLYNLQKPRKNQF